MSEAAGTPLLVFADDWGRHPSSCQHLVRHLLPDHPVVWVNTIGTRTPRLDRETLRRGLGKLRQWLPGARNAERGTRNGEGVSAPRSEPEVLNPKMWPSFGSALARRVNRTLLERQVGRALRQLPEPPVAVTTLPIVADLMGRLPVARWVYYCVDDFGEWPGLDRKTLAAMEREVVARADVLVAVSENLRRRLAAMGREARLLTHGVEPGFWSHPAGEPPAAVKGLERPLVVFWGVVDRRTDTDFVRRLAGELGAGTVVLVGPQNDPDPELRRLRRVALPGPVEFGELPALGREAAVLVMPYADLPVTRAMQPLKLKEYLATGKPVVARDLPANRAWADCLDLAGSPEEFAAKVRLRLTTGLPEEQERARRRLAGETWRAKAALLAEWALGERGGGSDVRRG